MKSFYALLAGLLLMASLSCKKSSVGSSGNDTGTTGSTSNTDIPNNAPDGVTFINSGKSAIFNLYAPGKTSVSVIGDFNNWQPAAMQKTSDGNRWWVQIDNLDASKVYAYQYYIDNTIKVADPYTELVLDPDNDKYITSDVYANLPAYPTGKTTGLVSTMQGSPTAYSWKNTSFTRPDKNKLVVYELLVRDFVKTHSYKTLTDTLSYLVNLGVNAIELMPVNEFEGNESWGYNTNFGFALDKYYGSKNDYKAFIDACHGKGIAVIQDIVLEDQFGSSPLVQMWATANGSPSASNPYMSPTITHPDAVGYQMNHQSAATQAYSENVMKYWMQEYHIDGFRFDQAKGFTQNNTGTVSNDATEAAWSAYDASRVALWTKYNSYMKGLDPTFYVILEYFAVNQEQDALASQGMMMWSNLNYNANQATMGYTDGWDLSGLNYANYGYSTPTGLMAYFESHDEERLQYKNEQYGNSSGTYNIKNLATGLKRDEMAAAFLFSAPGPKMLWQFGEQGYDVTIGSGSARVDDKPAHWEYMSDPNRHALYTLYSHMIRWKIKNDVFNTTSYKYDLGGYVKTIQLTGNGNNVEVIGNFDVNSQTSSISFPSTGTWYDNITGTSINVTALPYSVILAPGEYHVYSTTALTL